MTHRDLAWSVIATAGRPLDVLSGSITVDATRNPQVSADLTFVCETDADFRAFDPFTRAPVWIHITQSSFRSATITDLGTDPGTYSLGIDGALESSNARLRLYTASATRDEKAGTASVQLVSPDYFLTELVNLGAPWQPSAFSMVSGLSVYLLNRIWGEFFAAFDLPLFDATPAGGSFVSVADVDPWDRGENAWAYLDRWRTQTGDRYRLDLTTGAITFTAPLLAATVDRAAAKTVNVNRSTTDAAEGVNQYADAVAIRWSDPTSQGRADTWDIATGVDWRQARRPFIEDRDMVTTGAGVPPGLAAARLQRMSQWRRVTSATIPLDVQAMPFHDLTTHPQADSIQQVVYAYPSGDVTTTYLEGDS